MYEQYWGLAEKPFKNTMDSRFFYYSGEHEEALVRMLFCMTDQKGLMFLSGESGVGKTYLSRLFASQMREKGFRVATMVNPNLTPPQFLQEVLYCFDVQERHDNKVELLHYLHHFLMGLDSAGGQAILIIDEAQLIRDPETLEEIRLLLNLESDTRPLVNIIMIGQPELWSNARSLPQLLQRIGVAYQLAAFSEEDTRAYIRHRLTIAGAQKDIFTEEACAEVAFHSRGVAREINTICDMALLMACGHDKQQVDRDTIEECIVEMRGKGAGDRESAALLDDLAAK